MEEVISSALGEEVRAELLAAGINNKVYRLVSSTRDLIIRIPSHGKQLMSYGAINNSQIRQRFNLFAPSGFSPQVIDIDLPDGAVLCEYIEGRVARYPQDLSIISDSLAGLHSCGFVMPKDTDKDQLVDYRTMRRVVEDRMKHADAVQLSAGSSAILSELVTKCLRAPVDEIIHYEEQALVAPILKDANPGNFIITKSAGKEKAIVVDIEGGFYGSPVIDIGHSSLYSAALWECEDISPLAGERIISLYRDYLTASQKINGEEFSRNIFPPPQVLYIFRIITLCRCLTWMLNLIYFESRKEFVSDKLDRAQLILNEENLIIARDLEEELSRSWS